MLTCPEPTYEGMCRLLAAGHPSIGIFAAEGGQYIGGHGMSDDARLRTAAGLSAHGQAGRPAPVPVTSGIISSRLRAAGPMRFRTCSGRRLRVAGKGSMGTHRLWPVAP